MSEYEVYAFDPTQIANFRPQHHQLGRRMRSSTRSRCCGGWKLETRICYSNCGRERVGRHDAEELPVAPNRWITVQTVSQERGSLGGH
jgi:hypothetical protein